MQEQTTEDFKRKDRIRVRVWKTKPRKTEPTQSRPQTKPKGDVAFQINDYEPSLEIRDKNADDTNGQDGVISNETRIVPQELLLEHPDNQCPQSISQNEKHLNTADTRLIKNIQSIHSLQDRQQSRPHNTPNAHRQGETKIGVINFDKDYAVREVSHTEGADTNINWEDARKEWSIKYALNSSICDSCEHTRGKHYKGGCSHCDWCKGFQEQEPTT